MPSTPNQRSLMGWAIGLSVILSSCTTPSLQPDSVSAPQENSISEPDYICGIVETQPEFLGGHESLLAYLKRHQQYPAEAAEAGISGRVFISFIIETDGQIRNVCVLKGLGYGCDEEAARLVREMPRWKPGTQSGRVIKVKFNIPVNFGEGN